MTPLLITQLIIALGPVALELIPKLATIWTKSGPLSVAEVEALCAPAKKSYDDYLAAARTTLRP